MIFPVPINKYPFRDKGSITLISIDELVLKLFIVSGERMFANARRSEVQEIIVPLGEILGFPSDETVAT